MPQIFVLPEHIASQIAAGEVVERPASVVKELVENSIDAGASKIVIDIKEDCRYIRVSDNGCGMEAADASLAFQRHATSKLSNANDLWNLHTLGFRGEALPSIAAVSRLNCFTRRSESNIGTKVTCLDGAMTVTETGCNVGTIVEVEDLFFNVPARLSFLKRPSTEFGHILDIVQGLAISYANVSFELFVDSSLKLKTSGLNELEQTIVESNFFTEKLNFIPLHGQDGILGLEIEGHLAGAKHFRGDRKGIMIIVNKRPVRCSLSYKALDYAYADLIPRGRYPLAVLHLKVKPDELDINIHPTKKEIRYSRGNEVYLFIQRQIANALKGAASLSLNFAVNVSHEGKPPFSYDTVVLPKDSTSRKLDFSPQPSNTSFIAQKKYEQEKGKQLILREVDHTVHWQTASAEAKIAAVPDKNELDELGLKQEIVLPVDWHVVGYIANTYILLETREGLSIVEQHIAHERVLFERLLNKKPASEIQNIIISLPLQLTAEQKSVLQENSEDLKEQGFDFEYEGEEIVCTQVPLELANKNYALILQNILQELAESGSVNAKLDIVKSVACQSAIKNGMFLGNGQILQLLSDWHNTERNETCPHGRPIQISFTYEKLFQMFHPA